MKRIIPILLFLYLTGSSHAQLVVNAGVTPAQLVAGFMGSGLAVSNISLNCAPAGYGTFSNGNSTNLGVTNGGVFTTGSAAGTIGPDNTPAYTFTNGTFTSDPNLTTIEPQATNDPCILTFDVIPSCTTLTIRFVFGSEEYPEWVSAGFNDAFGFFITGPNPSGPAYAGYNVARLPNSTPVSIDNVNAGMNAGFYINNAGGATIQYDGITTVITSNLAVVPCSSYVFKIAIADAGDYAYDSGVFIDLLTCSSAITMSTSSVPTCGCTGSASVAAGGGQPPYTYAWTPGGQVTATATGLCPGNYTVSVVDQSGCVVNSNTSVVNVGSLAAGTPSIQSSINPSCFGGSNGSATATITGGTPAFTYVWSNGQTAQNVTGLTAGTYTVTVTDGNGCAFTTTVTITDPAMISANVTGIPAGCGISNGSATANPSGGTPIYSYAWSSGQTTQNISGLTGGSYTVTVTDSQGCTSTGTVNVSSSSAPVINASSTQAICGAANGSASASTTGGTAPYTYSWSNGQTTSSISNLAGGTYSVTVSDASCNVTGVELVANGDFSAGNTGFVSSYTYTPPPNGGEGQYWVAPGASVSSWNPGMFSNGDHTSGTGNFLIVNGAGTQGSNVWCQTIPVSPNTTYNFSTWVSSLNNSSPAMLQFSTNNIPLGPVFNAPATWGPWQQFFSIWNSGTNTSVTICVENMNTTLGGNDFGLDDISFQACYPCIATATITVTQTSLLTATTSQTNIPCNGGIGNATATPSGGTPTYTYAWSNGQTNQAATGLAAGNYTVVITDMNGCTSTNTVAITQPNLLAASFTQTNVSCNGGTNGSATVNPSGGTPNYTYSWAPSGGNSQTAINLGSGIYFCTVTDANGCTSVVPVTITQPAALVLAPNQTNILCNGNTNGSATVIPAGGVPGYNYVWSPTGGNAQTANNLSAGNYTVTVTDANGCTKQSIFTITQPPPISLAVSGDDSLCSGESTQLNAAASGGTQVYSYVWMPGPQSGTSLTITPTSSVSYSVSMTDANGCTSTVQTFNVFVFPAPNALFDTASTGMYSSLYSFTDLSNGGSSWSWNFGDNSTGSTLQNPVHTFPGAGTYTVTQIVFNQFGCPDTFKIVVDVGEGILIPNVFTPDGNGQNDVWYVPNSGVKEFHVVIFDRWGLKVWETTADEIRWDGRSSSGKLLTDGTYYFALDALLRISTGGIKLIQYTGYISLLTKTR